MKLRNILLVGLLTVLIFAGSSIMAQEDTLTVLCTPQEDWCVAMTQAFEAETGISTSYIRLSSGESLARLRATSSDPDFSVWWGGPADAYIAGIEEGLIEQYSSPNIDMIIPEYRDTEGYWTGVYVGALGFCSNLEILGELGLDPPTSWADLLDPALSSNLAMAHPATSGTAFTAFWTIITLEADALEAEEEGAGYDEDGAPTDAAIDNAFEYFAAFHQNVLQYTRSGSAPGRLAGQGEIAVAVIFSHDCVKLQEEGFEDVLVTTFPEEGTGYEIGGMAIIANGPEPIAARMWYDWALQADVQALGATVNALQLPTNPETPVSPLSVKLDEISIVNYNFAAAGARRSELVERFDEEIAPQPVE